MAETRPLLPALVFGGLIALGLASAGALVGNGLENARIGDRSVSVRGVSERIVKADQAVFPLQLGRAGASVADSQAAVDRDVAAVRQFLIGQGFPPAAVTVGRYTVTDQWAGVQEDQRPDFQWAVSQTVSVRTNDVDRVERTTRALNGLVDQGIVLQTYNDPIYTFTGLNALRPSMIKEATASARSGAQEFANDSGSTLGGIKDASQGYFEIVGQDEGAEASSQLNKRVRVVTSVSYRLR
jgi:hypothetical protein